MATDDQPKPERPCWIWVKEATVPEYAFCPFPGAMAVVEFALPVGWQLQEDFWAGVVLKNLYKERLTAAQVYAEIHGLGSRFGLRAHLPVAWRNIPPQLGTH